MERVLAQVEHDALAPIIRPPSRAYLLTCAGLAAVLAAALGTLVYQWYAGLAVTGLGTPVFWGVYIINFVFFIGISHAGTLLSAILRIMDAQWRRPFTRIAEMITITSLPFGASCVIVDMGRPDRLLNVMLYPHLTSPILWDVLCITTYMTLSCLYFYTALIPDLALVRDKATHLPAWRRRMYGLAALGWDGSPEVHRLHGRLMTVLSIILLGIVVSVHTNVAFVFGMTNKPGWHTAMIGPYFVIGAAFQGLAALATLSVLVRHLFGLKRWMPDDLYHYMGQFLVALLCFWVYLTFVEYLTAVYTGEQPHLRVAMINLTGANARLFWSMVACCALIPFPVLAVRRWRTPFNMAIAGIFINIGMWLERYSIVVPSGTQPYLTWGVGRYTPTIAELTITAGWLAGFVLLLLIFVRIFPPITVWEIAEGLESTPPPAPAHK